MSLMGWLLVVRNWEGKWWDLKISHWGERAAVKRCWGSRLHRVWAASAEEVYSVRKRDEEGLSKC